MAIERYCPESGCPGGDGCKNKFRDPFGACVMEYVAADLEPQFRWMGGGPPPKSWMVGNTKVYRSYADYCD